MTSPLFPTENSPGYSEGYDLHDEDSEALPDNESSVADFFPPLTGKAFYDMRMGCVALVF